MTSSVRPSRLAAPVPGQEGRARRGQRGRGRGSRGGPKPDARCGAPGAQPLEAPRRCMGHGVEDKTYAEFGSRNGENPHLMVVADRPGRRQYPRAFSSGTAAPAAERAGARTGAGVRARSESGRVRGRAGRGACARACRREDAKGARARAGGRARSARWRERGRAGLRAGGRGMSARVQAGGRGGAVTCARTRGRAGLGARSALPSRRPLCALQG